MKKLTYLLLPAAVILIALASFTTPEPKEEGIKWMTWKQMQEAQKKEPRKVVIDVYTDWCGWCKRMDQATYAKKEIIEYVNKNYYAIKFDAETNETLNFKGKDYNYVAQGNRGYNELAAEILNGQMSYPTTVFFDEKLNQIFPVPGYLEPRMFEKLVNYVHSNSYSKMEFTEYETTFVGTVQ